MNKSFFYAKRGVTVIFTLLLVLLLTNCKKEMDKYYEEGPGDIGPPIVEYLKNDPDFSKFSQLIDKAGIYSLLEKGAVYTMLAPTNRAIDEYNSTHPDNTTDNMDSLQLMGFIDYHVLFGIYYQYDFNKQYLRGAGNRYPSRLFDKTFHQYKSLSVFPPNFFGGSGQKDYTQDYENTYGTTVSNPQTSFNVEVALVLPEKMDIDCSNGVVHGINKVLEPKQNIIDFLESRPDFSIYNEFINRFDTLVYDSENSQIVDGVEQKAYKREFWYQSNTGDKVRFNFNFADESSDLTLFAPDNKTVDAFFGPYLDNFGGEYSNIPSYIIVELLNHNVARTVTHPNRLYPSGMVGGVRMSGNKTVFNFDDYIGDTALPLSNGLVYPVKTILNPPLLSRITGRILMNPEFSSMLYLLEETNRMNTIANAEYSSNEFLFGERVKLPKSWTIIAPSSAVFTDTLETGIEEWSSSQLRALADFLIIPDTIYISNPGEAAFDKGVNIKQFGNGYYKTNSRTFMRKSGNTLYSSLYPDSTATIIDEIYGSNGVIYVVDDMLYNVPSNYTVFSVLLNNVSSVSKMVLELTNGQHPELINELRLSSKDYTLFIPTDQALNAYDAVASGNDKLKAWADMSSTEKDYFIRNHIIPKRFVVESNKNMVHYSSVGEKIEISTQGGQLRVQGNTEIAPAGFISVNAQGSNGVVNFIDKVLLPDLSKVN